MIHFPMPAPGPTDEDPTLKPFSTLSEALAGFQETEPVLMGFSPRKKNFLAMVPPGGNWRKMPPEVAKESMSKAYFAKGERSGWWRHLP
jgi:DNA (cytosine-5)-methyltransferase 1